MTKLGENTGKQNQKQEKSDALGGVGSRWNGKGGDGGYFFHKASR